MTDRIPDSRALSVVEYLRTGALPVEQPDGWVRLTNPRTLTYIELPGKAYPAVEADAHYIIARRSMAPR